VAVIIDSTDFDGCVSNQVFRHHKAHKGDVVSSNPLLIQHCQSGVAADDTHYLLSGSMRQSQSYERTNIMGSKRASFPEWPKLAKAMGAMFTPLLLADWYAGVESGTAYKRAIEACGEHPVCPFEDESKLVLLLTQIHYFVRLHPQETIIFRFYDDKAKVLGNLSYFLSRHSELLPKAVQFEVYQYGDLVKTNYQAPVEPKAPVQKGIIMGKGEGVIDNVKFVGHLRGKVRQICCNLTEPVYKAMVRMAFLESQLLSPLADTTKERKAGASGATLPFFNRKRETPEKNPVFKRAYNSTMV